MEYPMLDRRNKEDIYKEFVELAKQYVPEWIPDSGNDAGDALARIFAEMFSQTVKRLNGMPIKNYLYFLNLLGAQAFDAVSAKGYATVRLNPGDYEGVAIPKGTRVYKLLEDGRRVLYELRDDMHAANNQILEIFCKNADGCVIVKPYDMQSDGNMQLCPHFSLFDFQRYENLQSIRLLLSGGNGLYVPSGAEVTLHLWDSENPELCADAAAELSKPECARWLLLSSDGAREISGVSAVGNKLSFCLDAAVDETELLNQKGRWLLCELLHPPARETLGFTQLRISSKAENVEPDILYYNDIPLTRSDFKPFGERFSEYDEFLFSADAVFCQRGARISVAFSLRGDMVEHKPEGEPRQIRWRPIMRESELKSPPPAVIQIERVLWEYWNGFGWNRLFPDNRYEGIFKQTEAKTVSLTFICPPDFAVSTQGAVSGRFLRARILSLSDMDAIYGLYNVPVVETMRISYDFVRDSLPAEGIYIEKDLKLTSLEAYGDSALQCEYPAAYISFANAFKGGPYKLYFKTAGLSTTGKAAPDIRFEYYGFAGGVYKWIETKPLEGSDFLAHSGIVTFFVKHPMKKCSLFGLDRYWMRIVREDTDPDDNSTCASFYGIHLNTCEITQQESVMNEYFFIEMQEPDKLCVLENQNVIWQSVWVNEKKEHPAMMAPVENEDVCVERDENGLISEYWVRWHETERFETARAADRVYRIDKKRGRILFGNGKNGKIPTYGENATIRVEYRVTMGAEGNSQPYTLEGFADSVPFVDSIYNVEALCGGHDIEKDADAVARSTHMTAIQDRAVSESDIVSLVKSADREIARVCVLRGAGELDVVILPKTIPLLEQSPRPSEYFDEIERSVRRMLAKKGPASFLHRIKVREVRYIQYKIIAEVTISNYRDYQEVNTRIENGLAAFLNPISGGFHSGGFEIGRMLTKTRVFMFLKATPKVVKVNNLNIVCHEARQEGLCEIDYEKAVMFDDAVPIPGRHELNLHILTEGGG